MIDRTKVSEALYAIHKPSFYLSGLTAVGEAWLASGKSFGPDKDQMPLTVGMLRHSCCGTCVHVPGKSDQWPCDTVKLLLEADVIEPFSFAVHASNWDTEPAADIDFGGLTDTVNIRPDREPEIWRH